MDQGSLFGGDETPARERPSSCPACGGSLESPAERREGRCRRCIASGARALRLVVSEGELVAGDRVIRAGTGEVGTVAGHRGGRDYAVEWDEELAHPMSDEGLAELGELAGELEDGRLAGEGLELLEEPELEIRCKGCPWAELGIGSVVLSDGSSSSSCPGRGGACCSAPRL